jgi:hypothetical protein
VAVAGKGVGRSDNLNVDQADDGRREDWSASRCDSASYASTIR